MLWDWLNKAGIIGEIPAYSGRRRSAMRLAERSLSASPLAPPCPPFFDTGDEVKRVLLAGEGSGLVRHPQPLPLLRPGGVAGVGAPHLRSAV